MNKQNEDITKDRLATQAKMAKVKAKLAENTAKFAAKDLEINKLKQSLKNSVDSCEEQAQEITKLARVLKELENVRLTTVAAAAAATICHDCV